MNDKLKEKLTAGFYEKQCKDAVDAFVADAKKLDLNYILIAQNKEKKFVDFNIEMSPFDLLAHIASLLLTLEDKDKDFPVETSLNFVKKVIDSYKKANFLKGDEHIEEDL